MSKCVCVLGSQKIRGIMQNFISDFYENTICKQTCDKTEKTKLLNVENTNKIRCRVSFVSSEAQLLLAYQTFNWSAWKSFT